MVEIFYDRSYSGLGPLIRTVYSIMDCDNDVERTAYIMALDMPNTGDMVCVGNVCATKKSPDGQSGQQSNLRSFNSVGYV